MDDLKLLAAEILRRHGQASQDLRYFGAGEQSVCYGAGSYVVLLDGGQTPPECNDYRLQQWMTIQAVRAGVRTPRILAVGDEPRPYALMQAAPGHKATELTRSLDEEVGWFYAMGAEVRKINQIATSGFGPLLVCCPVCEQSYLDGQEGPGVLDCPVCEQLGVLDESEAYRGRYATWSDYLDAQCDQLLFTGHVSREGRAVQTLWLAQGIITTLEFEKIATQVQRAKQWPVQSVLTHYDNRLDNLMLGPVDISQPSGRRNDKILSSCAPDEYVISLLDWGLAFAGIGIQQELIKLFEYAPYSMQNPRVAAFLHGYGLAEAACAQVIEGGKLMLILDGLAMSYGWATAQENRAGIRSWLRTIKEICDEWEGI